MNILIAFAIVGAALDRLWGSDTKIMGRSGHSLATVGALLAAGACWFGLHSPAAVAVCIAWPVYRSLNFSGGAMAPENATQALAALGRHLSATAVLCAIVGIQHQGFTRLMLPAVGYALIATGLAVINGATKGRMNWAVETVRGAAFGACSALALGLL